MSEAAKQEQAETTDQSPTIGALAAALAKAQGAMGHASKDKTNPHFKSQYADLASVWDACRAPLSANGLAVIQRASNVPGGVCITTILAHSSGEWIRDRLSIPLRQNDAQALGSAITYGRRYALAAMVGIAPDEGDDDGNAAVGQGSFNPPKASRTSQLKEKMRANVQAKADAANTMTGDELVKITSMSTEKLRETIDGARKWIDANRTKATKEKMEDAFARLRAYQHELELRAEAAEQEASAAQ